MKRVLAAIAISSISIPLATAQENRVEQRQEVREDRREARQARAEQRLDNRSQYYTSETWSQLDPWLKRNSVAPMERIAQAAETAVGAAEKALNTANNLADRANNQAHVRYGYINPNGQGENGWFYDYYSYSPTDSPEDASRHTVSGKVYASKSAKVDGAQNLIVRLSEPKGNDGKGDEAQASSSDASIVDIGPVSTWKDKPLQVDVAISATGPIERVGDKPLLIAETVKIGDAKEVFIARGTAKIEGQVVDVTTIEIKGKSHTLAVVEVESKRQLVDLGPTENLKVKVEPQTKIVVQGVPVRVRNHSIVQAESVSLNGQDAITIRRW